MRRDESRLYMYFLDCVWRVWYFKEVKGDSMNVYELLDKMRRRPGMYIGVANPTYLYSFLSGYFMDREEMINENHNEPDFHLFHDFIAKRFGYESSSKNWSEIIEEQSDGREDKEDALWIFFELLDEFRGIVRPEIARISCESKFDNRWYSSIIIRKIDINKGWYSLVLYDENNKILDLWDFDTLEKLYNQAFESYGIKKEDWRIK